MSALLKAIQYQSTLALDTHLSGTGLMRLLLGVSANIWLRARIHKTYYNKGNFTFFKISLMTFDFHGLCVNMKYFHVFILLF